MTGFEEIFEFDDFKTIAQMRSINYPEIKELISRKTYNQIIDDIYRVGIIGNTGQRTRFAFRGDSEPDYYSKFIFHSALYNVLAIKT